MNDIGAGATSTRKISILIVGLNYVPEPTGISVYTSGLADGLKSRGHEVNVKTGYPHYPAWRIDRRYRGIRRTENINGIEIKRYRHFVPKRASPVGRIAMEVSFGLSVAFSKWGKNDVIICVSPSLLGSTISILRQRILRTRTPMAIWVQDLYSAGVRETDALHGTSASITTWLESLSLRSFDKVVVIHERFRKYVENELKVNASQIVAIRNWTHVRLPSMPGENSQRKGLSRKGDECIVLHAGNLGAKQAMENVIEAAKIAQSKSISVKFVLLGDGNKRAELEEKSRGLETIEFIDPLPDHEFMEAIRSADILLVNEGKGVFEMAVPSKLTTYFASGLPIIAATEAGSITASEIEQSGGGIRVDPGSPSALLRVVEKLQNDPQAQDRMGTAGRAYSFSKLSQQSALDDFETILLAMANNGENRRAT